MLDTQYPGLREAMKTLVAHCHGQASEMGWWLDPTTGAPRARHVGELLMLIVSELAEGMEAHRKGLTDSHLPGRPGLEVELADAVIRIADMAGGLKLDLAGALVEKLAYNRQRADHQLAERAKAGGKAY